MVAPGAGTYTLEVPQLLNFLPATSLYLVDALTNQRINLAQQPSYSLSGAATLRGRFSLVFGPAGALATVPGLTAASVGVYPNPAAGAFTVAVPAVTGASRVQATLLNSLGQEMARQSTAGVLLSCERGQLSSGIYLLRVQAEGASVVKRITLE